LLFGKRNGIFLAQENGRRGSRFRCRERRCGSRKKSLQEARAGRSTSQRQNESGQIGGRFRRTPLSELRQRQQEIGRISQGRDRAENFSATKRHKNRHKFPKDGTPETSKCRRD